MGLEQFYTKLNKYEKKITKKIKKEKRKNIKIISTSIIISLILSYIIIELINPKWFRIFKIKVKYDFFELIKFI